MRGKDPMLEHLYADGGNHPRLCGEKTHFYDNVGMLNRITPAYAGKSIMSHLSDDKAADHPRLCGEKI